MRKEQILLLHRFTVVVNGAFVRVLENVDQVFLRGNMQCRVRGSLETITVAVPVCDLRDKSIKRRDGDNHGRFLLLLTNFTDGICGGFAFSFNLFDGTGAGHVRYIQSMEEIYIPCFFPNNGFYCETRGCK